MNSTLPTTPPVTHHASRITGLSQCDLVLERLQASTGQWVSMLDLFAVSGSMVVHSRISDLRARGHNIHHKNEWAKTGACCSFYKLISPSVPPCLCGEPPKN